MNIIEARTKIVARQAFSAGNVTGNSNRVGPFDTGRLPADHAANLLAVRDAADLFVVYSYATPIAWYANGSWTVPPVKYSPTTSKQMTRAGIWQLAS
jgi:hypothetical protein